MKKNREIARQQFADEMKWLKENVAKLTQNKHKFLLDMYQYLITGSRKITPKMGTAIQTSIDKCNKPNPPVEYKDKNYCNWYCAKKKG